MDSDRLEVFVAVAKERGKHLAVAYQRHLEGAYMYLRDLVQSGALGEVQFVSAYQAQAWLKEAWAALVGGRLYLFRQAAGK